MPIHLEGLTGPGAPHHLEIVRRTDSGLSPEEISHGPWNIEPDPDDVILRCKQWMASADYNLSTLLYPRQVGLQLMPVGLPQGLAERREIPAEQISHVENFLPNLRFPLYRMSRCADFLEQWIHRTLPQEDLLDVSVCMIKTGPLSLHSNAAPMHPDSFDIPPNIMRMVKANKGKDQVNIYLQNVPDDELFM